MVSPFLVPCLVELRTTINARFAGRDKASDGWIGDPAHQATQSDHNPDSAGRVHAIDVDADLRDQDVTMLELVDKIVAGQRGGDDRLEYVIFDQRIASRSHGWTWRVYTGANPHDKHAHFSARHTAARDSRRGWLMPARPPEDDVALTPAEIKAIGTEVISQLKAAYTNDDAGLGFQARRVPWAYPMPTDADPDRMMVDVVQAIEGRLTRIEDRLSPVENG